MDNPMIIENMETDEGIRATYSKGSEEYNNSLRLVKEVFSNIDDYNWQGVTGIQKNIVTNDSVISAILSPKPGYLNDLDTVLVSRKYLLDKKYIYDKVYYLLSNKTCNYQLPEGSHALAEGYLINVYGQPGDEDYSNFIDIYFSCPDHSAVESFANKTFTKGTYSNYYCATFNKDTKELIRVKNYWYNEQSIMSDWDEYWVVHCKKRGVDPLAELS